MSNNPLRKERSGACETIRMLARYKAWANTITFSHLLALPGNEVTRLRPTRFGSIVHTLNHVYVVDDIFRAHLEGGAHGYTDRNTEAPPDLPDLWSAVQELDRWYVAYADGLDGETIDEPVYFRFVDGKPGRMTRGEILLHVINHGSYHRGFVGDLLYQIPSAFPANDLTIFLQTR